MESSSAGTAGSSSRNAQNAASASAHDSSSVQRSGSSANSPTSAEAFANSPTTAEALAHRPSLAERLAQTPSLAERLAQTPTPVEHHIEQPAVEVPEPVCRFEVPPGGPHARETVAPGDLTGPTRDIQEFTPGAEYQPGVTPEDLGRDLRAQAAYAREQWQQGFGVVGPMGSEQNRFFGLLNNPESASFPTNQQFGYHHDLQSADAARQLGINYPQANSMSALCGYQALNATGSVDRGLEAARDMWSQFGFEVRQRY